MELSLRADAAGSIALGAAYAEVNYGMQRAQDHLIVSKSIGSPTPLRERTTLWLRTFLVSLPVLGHDGRPQDRDWQ